MINWNKNVPCKLKVKVNFHLYVSPLIKIFSVFEIITRTWEHYWKAGQSFPPLCKGSDTKKPSLSFPHRHPPLHYYKSNIQNHTISNVDLRRDSSETQGLERKLVVSQSTDSPVLKSPCAIRWWCCDFANSETSSSSGKITVGAVQQAPKHISKHKWPQLILAGYKTKWIQMEMRKE